MCSILIISCKNGVKVLKAYVSVLSLCVYDDKSIYCVDGFIIEYISDKVSYNFHGNMRIYEPMHEKTNNLGSAQV